MQTSNADRRCSCPMLRCCQMNSCRYVGEEGSGRSELTMKLPFRPHFSIGFPHSACGCQGGLGKKKNL